MESLRSTFARVRRIDAKPLLRRLRPLFFVAAGLAVASWLVVLMLRWIDPPTTMFMLLDSSGVDPIAYEWTDWPEISPSAALAVVASEDQKFPTHFGFDLASIQDSIDARATGGPVRGASTITQQVAKNLFLWPGRSFVRKGIEAYMTLAIEILWPKRRILEVYLNVAEFGPGVYGVGAASRTYFRRSATDLTDAEAALLASVLPNPKLMRIDRPSEYVRKRQGWVIEHIGRLRRDGALSAIE
jgi:monofunctional biosynthetic peptidoglycan transglycosylase